MVVLPVTPAAAGSAKSIIKSPRMAPVTAEASLPAAKAESENVTVKLLISLTLAWEVALPVKLNVACVLSTWVTTAVSPVGTWVTTAPDKTAPLVPAKVALLRVMLRTTEIEPSLAVASVKVVES